MVVRRAQGNFDPVAQIVDERVRRQSVDDLCHLVQFVPADTASPGMNELPPHVGSQVGHASGPVPQAPKNLVPKVVWIAGGCGSVVGPSTAAGPMTSAAVTRAVERADDRTHVPGLRGAAVVVVVVLDEGQPVRAGRFVVLVGGLARKTPDDSLVPAKADASRETRAGKDEQPQGGGCKGRIGPRTSLGSLSAATHMRVMPMPSMNVVSTQAPSHLRLATRASMPNFRNTGM